MILNPDIAIVGGGAAGLAAAIFAAESARGQKRIVILDGAKSLGAKILVSGGGRCNVTHDVVTPDDFNGTKPVVRNILAAFRASAAAAWFASLGVTLKREETGKLFPVGDSARIVLDALMGRCRELGVEIQCGRRVNAIMPPREADPYFTIEHDGGQIRATRIIMATGGRTLPRSGSDGSGWNLVRPLGHTVTPTYAALAPLVLESAFIHGGLSGIAQDVQLSTFVDGQLIDRRRGSLLWTHFGISGPVVMDASRHWIIAHESGKPARMECHLLPPDDFESLEKWLVEQASSCGRTSILGVLSTRLPERVARAIIIHAAIDPTIACAQLSRAARRSLVGMMTALPLPILRHRGWNYAEVTAGGVPLDEINFRTMESRKQPGLYLVGEMLDCDGRIGGFNFQWAWSTGHIAGTAAGK
jgi:predicted Rossmann fold flavoprotein